MSHPITMTWINKSNTTLNFSSAVARDGTTPVASPGTMGSGGSSSVSADQSHNLGAGPVGNYNWVNATDANQSIATSYVHPSGTGQSSVTVACSSGYQVSDDGVNFVQSKTYTDASLQQHSAVITLTVISATG